MSSTVQPGEVLLGKYRVERVLGKGGMGIVVAARHVHLGELFAIKMLLPEAMDHHEAVERFLREARASAKLKGEHVARVHDVGSLENGIPYMVLEYLDGQDLKKVVRSRGGLPLDEAALYVYQACEAVSEAHSNGIVHRDLKPANLFLIQRPNGSPCVKVLDFGISKEIDPTNQLSSDLTRTGAFMGSPLYMSPEQMANIKAADVRTDIWALGVILYELAVGRVPFTAAAVTELVTKVLTTSPIAPSLARPGIPTAFDAIVLKCLEKQPEHRFQSVRELMEQLLPYANVLPQPRASSRAPVASASALSHNAAPLVMAAPAPIANTFSTTVLMDSPTVPTNSSALQPAVPVAPDPITAGAWGQTNPAAVGKKDKTALIAGILAVGVVGLGGVIFAATRSTPEVSATNANPAISTTSDAPRAVKVEPPTGAASESAPNPAPTNAPVREAAAEPKLEPTTPTEVAKPAEPKVTSKATAPATTKPTTTVKQTTKKPAIADFYD